MQIIFSPEEAERIVLDYVSRTVPEAAFNTVTFKTPGYYSVTEVRVEYVAPPSPVPQEKIAAILAEPSTDLNALTEALQP